MPSLFASTSREARSARSTACEPPRARGAVKSTSPPCTDVTSGACADPSRRRARRYASAVGTAYVEAMAGGVPAIGCRGEPGPEEIAAAGDGLVLVPPGDIERLSQRIDELLSDPHRLREAGQRARQTVAAHFTWERCGRQTVAAYERALR